jgi:hypothetical protein
MKQNLLRIFAIFLLTILLAGCGNPPATTAPAATETQAPTEAEPTTAVASASPVAATSTLDPCVLPQLELEVQRVHKHMREFDDAAALASSIPRDQLTTSIADLQRIRRGADDEQIPVCLGNLKAIQVQHMNTVIDTLLAFMRGTDQETLDQGIALARQQHDQYLLEYVRVLGLTVIPATIPPAPTETPSP